jgi:phage major head subunit gpT-like protein
MDITPANMEMLYTAYSAAFQEGLRAAETWYQMIATEVPSTTAQNTYSAPEETPRMREWKGEREIDGVGFIDFVIPNRTFESTVEVPRERVEDDSYGQYTPLVSDLGDGASHLYDDLLIELIEDGESIVCYDGQNFFDTDHPVSQYRPGLGTQSNLLTGKPLTADNFQAARAAMWKLKDATGKPARIKPTILMVPPDLEKKADDIVVARTGANGADNTLVGKCKVMVNPDLTNQDDWYLLATGRKVKPFIVQKRRQWKLTRFDSEKDEHVFKRNKFIYGTDARGAAGFGRWQYIIKVKAA